MWEHAGVVIAVVGLVVNLVGSAVIITRAIGKLEVSLRGAITIERKEIDAAISMVRTDVEDRYEQIERRYGETAAALRERIATLERELLAKITDFEKWSRDIFVRREGFYKVRDDLQADLKELGTQIYQRLERMEKKIDGARG